MVYGRSKTVCFRYNYSYYMGSVLAAIPRGVFAGQSLADLPKTSDNFLI